MKHSFVHEIIQYTVRHFLQFQQRVLNIKFMK